MKSAAVLILAWSLMARANCPVTSQLQSFREIASASAPSFWECPTASAAHAGHVSHALSSCTQAMTEVAQTKIPTVFIDEHVLNTDPAKIASMQISGVFRFRLPSLALCAEKAREPIATQAREALKSFLLSWAGNYTGDGNPINESHIIPILQAALAADPRFSPTEAATFKSALNKLDSRLSEFWRTTGANDTRRTNNWMMDSLALRAYSATLANDAQKLNAVRTELNQQIASQYSQPANWKPSSCQNLASIGAYGSFDLQQRDALLYHVKGLGRAFELKTYLPELFTPESNQLLSSAMGLTKDYVLGTKSHKEFVCTTVQFDIDRGKAGIPDYTGAPWNPNSNRDAYRYARMSNPELRDWTTSFADSHYPSWMIALASCRGDSQ